MNQFKITPQAYADLKEIARYTQNKWGVKKRNLYIFAINNRFEWLSKNPEIGKSRDDIKKGYLSYPEGKHVIFYKAKINHIEILSILHQSMDYQLHL